ncbi:MAG: septum formation initiator family protein, partial [Anoxybacillus ayderensis]|nr:septum formation initiator family protein [Anoxybacillus ayderensis]
MGAPQKSKVKKIQTSYVIQQEKQEHKKARRRKKIVIRFSFVATIALAASSLFLYTMMAQSSMIDEQIRTKEQLEEKLHT